MRAGADLTMRGIASLLGEFLERLDLREVTLGVSDWDGPPTLRGRRRSLTKVLLSAESGRTVVEPDVPAWDCHEGGPPRWQAPLVIENQPRGGPFTCCTLDSI